MNKDFSGQAEILITFPSGQTSCPVILENIFLLIFTLHLNLGPARCI